MRPFRSVAQVTRGESVCVLMSAKHASALECPGSQLLVAQQGQALAPCQPHTSSPECSLPRGLLPEGALTSR